MTCPPLPPSVDVRNLTCMVQRGKIAVHVQFLYSPSLSGIANGCWLFPEVPEIGRTLYICAPEDIVLHKLLWHAAGSGVSDRQWYDLQGVLRLQAHDLDLAYLRHWAEVLCIGALL